MTFNNEGSVQVDKPIEESVPNRDRSGLVALLVEGGEPVPDVGPVH